MSRSVLWLTVLVGIAGCRSLALFWPEQTRTVAAEYPYLADKSVVILVRAPDEVLFEHPHVQWELADHVRVALEGKIRGVSIVEPRKVFDMQRADQSWRTQDPARLGRQFQADRLMEIDLLQYTTRDPDSPFLLRAHILAAVRVYNTEYTDAQPAYRTEVRTVYPPDGPGRWGSDERSIRAAAMERFAQDLAGRFYDRKVVVK